jgi:hypothetical protein
VATLGGIGTAQGRYVGRGAVWATAVSGTAAKDRPH